MIENVEAEGKEEFDPWLIWPLLDFKFKYPLIFLLFEFRWAPMNVTTSSLGSRTKRLRFDYLNGTVTFQVMAEELKSLRECAKILKVRSYHSTCPS